MKANNKLRERGNAAAMREALETVRKYVKETTPDKVMLCVIESWCDKALAKPPRNCDRYNNESCRMAYHLHGDGLMTMQSFADWLFAPTTGKEGGNNAD